MKKLVLSLAVVCLAAGSAMAQKRKSAPAKPQTASTTQAPAPAASPMVAPPAADPHAGHNHDGHETDAAAMPTVAPENMVFNTENHNFGTVQEGAPAEFTFTFRNTSNQPIVLQRVQPACGCTAADYTKEPVLPGQSGYIKAAFGTQGRPGTHSKTIAVLSNAGARTLSFTINVEKAPTSSVPANGSMMQAN